VSKRVAALLLTSALLSGCGVGLHSQTYKETGRGDSSSVDLESVLVRNLHIEAPLSGSTLAAGSDAVLTGTLASKGKATDTLTSVTTDAATTVVLQPGGFGTDPGFPRFGEGSSVVAVPAGGHASEWRAVLQGLTEELRSGEYVSVTLSFRDAGQTTLRVPVHIREGDLENREVIQHPYGEGE
jgi:copper(I)-binding protein